ncbi:hypothetical protein TNCT_481521 [Trichonephila clavata]|uniref:Uncharacterized protein n=1 Tax=Trichonephila clavata TaxID=2740835 RepID=A0A8X6JWP0_TRICU|nr:hypothetical protein TNCT_481521 [Trichonephila clavata]
MQNIDNNLPKFWETGTINKGQKFLTKEEEYCENHYQMTHMRDEAGRHMVHVPAYLLNTFVGNRKSKIKTLTENFEGKHIPSALSPADIISQGVNPEERLSLTLWWNGPQNLAIPEQFSEPSVTSSDEPYT